MSSYLLPALLLCTKLAYPQLFPFSGDSNSILLGYNKQNVSFTLTFPHHPYVLYNIKSWQQYFQDKYRIQSFLSLLLLPSLCCKLPSLLRIIEQLCNWPLFRVTAMQYSVHNFLLKYKSDHNVTFLLRNIQGHLNSPRKNPKSLH